MHVTCFFGSRAGIGASGKFNVNSAGTVQGVAFGALANNTTVTIHTRGHNNTDTGIDMQPEAAVTVEAAKVLRFQVVTGCRQQRHIRSDIPGRQACSKRESTC